ncbi:MAG: protein phosphatase 2C domain-containing protein [Acidimicrobiales bacterium]|nr:protein phosphatase 2C domain-containing protein [Actinomycetota bacterium]
MSAVSAAWSGAGASVRGAQHRRCGMPNQDAIGWWRPPAMDPGAAAGTARATADGAADDTAGDTAHSAAHLVAVEGDLLAAAVADGHGHPRGVRADVGARLAVATALDLVAASYPGLRAPEAAHRLLDDLPARIPALWSERVASDLAAHPLGEDDLERAVAGEGPAARAALEHDPAIAYGTTVILVAATPEHLLVAQLGDGDVLVAGRRGALRRPLRKDPELVANRTWSLASPDASRHFETAFVPHDLTTELVLAATDGYANSYRDPSGFDQVASDMLAMVRDHGMALLARSLPHWLESTSEQGSGDDITVAVLARTGGTRP